MVWFNRRVLATRDLKRFVNKILFLSRMTGAVPFDGELKVRYRGIAQSVLVHGLVLAMFGYWVVYLNSLSYRRGIAKYLDGGELLVVNTTCLGVVSAYFVASHRIPVIFSRLLETGIRLGAPLYSASYFVLLRFTAFFLYSVEVGLLLKLFPPRSFFDFYIPTMLSPYALLLFMGDLFHCFSLVLKAQFDTLNSLVRRTVILTLSVYPPLERISRLHTSLCDVSDELGALFSFFFLANVTAFFLIVVGNLYFIILASIESTVHRQGLDRTGFTVANVFWMLMWVTEVGSVIYSCKSITEKSKEFNKALYELMIEDNTNELAKNEKLQLHIAMKREAHFTACGLFPIDFTLIHSMIAAATTYLVILVQFDQMNSPDTTDPTSLHSYNNSTTESFTTL